MTVKGGLHTINVSLVYFVKFRKNILNKSHSKLTES